MQILEMETGFEQTLMEFKWDVGYEMIWTVFKQATKAAGTGVVSPRGRIEESV